MHGCRCEDCSRARHDARVARGETNGSRGYRGPNSLKDVIEHGTRRGYAKEKRLGLGTCEECRKANAKEAMDRKHNKKSLACGEKASFSAVTGTLPVRVGLGQPVQKSLFE